jgi:type VI secretion system secreted protein VgrG
MVKFSRQTDKLFMKLSGDAAADLICTGTRIRDRLSTIPEMRMEFYSKKTDFDPATVLGTRITMEAENTFKFSGIVISVEDLGHQDSIDLFAAEIRPWPWLFTIGSDNRVFQGKSAPEIIKDVCNDAGFSDLDTKLTGTYETREYCVQYNETNFDFICRLMEEEGIYYYFDHSGASEKLVLADSVSAHTNGGTVPFTISNQVGDKQGDSNSIFEWSEVGRVVTGKLSLFDYDMTLPNADLKVTSNMPSGKHGHNAIERYEARGHYKVADKGEGQARAGIEAHVADAKRYTGVANAPIIATGAIFTLDHAERTAVNGAYLVVGTTHYIQFDPGYKDEAPQSLNRHVERIEFPAEMGIFETEFEVQRDSVQFRPPRQTAWPEVPALLTAIVTGPGGEEIHTDEYGRIKVQFPWDREGKNDDKTSCWVRSVMPWTGKDWGMQSIPRIGMEVIIQFERGNIDRPYCTGMVYNGVNKPPYPLPAEMTKTGIRTNSSKGGGGFHELTFDDKKDAETVFFQSEKDYKQIVKNNAEITIGMEKQDEGSLVQTIYKDSTETIKTGDMKLVIETGSRITDIKTDETTTIEGKSTHKITGDTSLEVTTGNLSEKISSGNMSTEVSMGNQSTKVSMGNVTIDAELGKVAITALQEITLTVGGSSIKIDQVGVTITGAVKVSVSGGAMTEVGAPMVKVAGQAMVQVQGGIVMIN